MLLPLRPAALVAEEVAWLAARFPGRVGVGVASGALQDDFDIMHVPMDGLTARFSDALTELAGMLDGTAPRWRSPVTRRSRRAPSIRSRS